LLHGQRNFVLLHRVPPRATPQENPYSCTPQVKSGRLLVPFVWRPDARKPRQEQAASTSASASTVRYLPLYAWRLPGLDGHSTGPYIYRHEDAPRTEGRV